MLLVESDLTPCGMLEARSLRIGTGFIGLAVAAAVFVAASGCDIARRSSEVVSRARPKTSNGLAALDTRLWTDLATRRQWPVGGVKIWLKNPTVATEIRSVDGKNVRVHAWAENENDFNVAMMRLDEGPTLYAITRAEFEEVRDRGGSCKGEE